MKVGDKIRDNDPRMGTNRVLTIAEISDGYVVAVSWGRRFRIRADRIHADGKKRRSGFDLIAGEAQ